jgi:hypothetical protein
VWHDASGLAPPADLWVEAEGRPVLQVSSVGSHPFARAGLDLAPIEPNVPYNIVFERRDDVVNVTLVRVGGGAVVHTQIHAGDARTADNGPSAAVVLPASFWRSTVSVE